MINFNKSDLCISKDDGRKRFNSLVLVLGIRQMTEYENT